MLHSNWATSRPSLCTNFQNVWSSGIRSVQYRNLKKYLFRNPSSTGIKAWSGTGMLRYGTEMVDVGIPMPAASTSMPVLSPWGFLTLCCWKKLVKSCDMLLWNYLLLIQMLSKTIERSLWVDSENAFQKVVLDPEWSCRKPPVTSKIWRISLHPMSDRNGDPINQSQKREFTQEISELLSNYIEANKKAFCK